MQASRHIQQRMSQRGITGKIVETVLMHGRIDQDKTILDRRGAVRLLEKLKEEEAILKKIIDKGGVVVVTEGEHMITTYNFASRRRVAHD